MVFLYRVTVMSADGLTASRDKYGRTEKYYITFLNTTESLSESHFSQEIKVNLIGQVLGQVKLGASHVAVRTVSIQGARGLL